MCVGRYFKELSHILVEIWQVQNWQGRLASWRLRQGSEFKPKCCSLVEFSLCVGREFFLCKSLQMIGCQPLT